MVGILAPLAGVGALAGTALNMFGQNERARAYERAARGNLRSATQAAQAGAANRATTQEQMQPLGGRSMAAMTELLQALGPGYQQAFAGAAPQAQATQAAGAQGFNALARPAAPLAGGGMRSALGMEQIVGQRQDPARVLAALQLQHAEAAPGQASAQGQFGVQRAELGRLLQEILGDSGLRQAQIARTYGGQQQDFADAMQRAQSAGMLSGTLGQLLTNLAPAAGYVAGVRDSAPKPSSPQSDWWASIWQALAPQLGIRPGGR